MLWFAKNASGAKTHVSLVMVMLGRLFSWRDALVNVQPNTFIRWHRKRFRLLWRWKSRPGSRPQIPEGLQKLIRKMAAENPTWGEERIANELKVKLSIQRAFRSPRALSASIFAGTGRCAHRTRNSAG